MEQAAKMKDDQIRQLEDAMRRLRQNLDQVSVVLSLKPNAGNVEAALRRKPRRRFARPRT